MLKLRPYQEVGRDFLAAHHCALLADEMRVGKTPQAILAAAKLEAQRVVVVCPAIAVPGWYRQWREWWPDERAGKVSFSAHSYDAMRNYTDNFRKPMDVLVVDECHYAKDPRAQRTKMLYGKDGVANYAQYVWALSGTPAQRDASELWPMMRAFGMTPLPFKEFCQYFCVVDPITDKVLGTRTDRIPELRAILAKFMLRRTRKEVAPESPAIDFQFLAVEPTPGVDLHGDDADAMLANPDEYKADRQNVALAKVGQLADAILEDMRSGFKQTVVFGWHVAPLVNMAQTLRNNGLNAELLMGATSSRERERIQADFRYGRLDVIVANVLTAGTAIDLSAASHGYFLELDWLPGNNVQAANRLVSLEKLEPVTFDVCTWSGSADDRVQKKLLRRAKELAIMI